MVSRGKTLYAVVPCYNEEEVINETARRLKEKFASMKENDLISSESRIAFVNDGSKDSTWDKIVSLCESDEIFCGIDLSRNRGHQNALLAGLMTVKDYADMAISLDADLQDDIDVLDEFVRKYLDGCEIVYGVRSSRDSDTAFKRTSAEGYYKFLSWMGVDVVYNHADYRLMSKRALDELRGYGEVNLFLRGIVPLIGFKTDTVEYARSERFAGESKYPLKKMISLAFEGITSFSVRPIRLITILGLIIFSVSIVILIYSLIVYFMGKTVTGWTTTVLSIWALGGLQLLSIGIIGEYIGKIYLETKDRPRYIVREFIRK